MRNNSALHSPVDLAQAIDQLKLVQSVLQRIANTTGKKIYSSELANGHNVVEPDMGSADWLTELELKK